MEAPPKSNGERDILCRVPWSAHRRAYLIPQSGMVPPAIRRKVILVINCLYGQDGTDVRAGCGALRAGLSDRCATTWQDRKYHCEGF